MQYRDWTFENDNGKPDVEDGGGVKMWASKGVIEFPGARINPPSAIWYSIFIDPHSDKVELIGPNGQVDESHRKRFASRKINRWMNANDVSDDTKNKVNLILIHEGYLNV